MPSCVWSDMCYENRCSAITWKSKQRIWFGGYTDTDQGRFRFVINFGFPIVDFILLWYRQVTLHAAFGVEELDFCPGLDKTVCDFELWLKFPR